MQQNDEGRPAGETIRVWDLPVRLFHWTLVTLMVVSYFTGRAGGDWMKFHFWSGYGILTLLLFRIMWGFVGSTTARFTHFVKGPSAAIAHLRELLGKEGPHDAGHNPAGAAMVLVLIFAVLLQVLTGFFSADTDEGTVSGPLTSLASDKFIDKATSFHHFWINVLLVLAALHVLAALIYLVWKRQNLIGAMCTGRKPRRHVVPSGEAVPMLTFGSNWLALVLLMVSAAIVYGIVHMGG
jgi:cytochrome b